MKWLREAVSDQDGLADMAYIVIGALAVSAICSLAFILAMATVSYIRCTHIVDVGEGVRAAISCVFDPLPVGQSAGLIFGAFGALIGALAGYMAATRRASAKTVTTEVGGSRTITTEPIPTATATEPMPVKIIARQPVPTRETPVRKKPKRTGR